MKTPDQNASVLIVEDDPVQSQIVTAMIQRLGRGSRTAANLSEARDYMGDPALRTILLDLNLGDEAGLDVLHALKGSDHCGSLIIMSGCDERIRSAAIRVARAEGLPVCGALSKPVQLADLATLLEMLPEAQPTDQAAKDTSISIADVAEAIELGEILPVYQPKVDLRTNEPVGVEALARWTSHKYGHVSPEVFIPLAEAGHLMPRLTRTILTEAVMACARWCERFPTLSVAVNVAPSILNHDTYVLIRDTLASSGLAPGLLTVEVTETGAIGESAQICDVLTRLRIYGVQLSIDDFGTGHSSLVSLLCMPFSELKLDRLFVQELTHNPDARRILSSIVALAGTMKLRTVAEGIESEQVRRILAELGCETGQGWLWSHALSESELATWLQTRTFVSSGYVSHVQ